MASILTCIDCDGALPISSALMQGKRIRCPSCLAMFELGLGSLGNRKGLRAGDDDEEESGGNEEESGGDEEESGEDETKSDDASEEESEETDEGGKKKKKAKKEVVGGGCSFMFIALIGAFLLLCCTCGIVGYYTGLIKPGAPSLAGTWKGKEGDAELQLALESTGVGTYTKGDAKPAALTWKTVDANTVAIEMNDASTKLWTNEAKTNFTTALAGSQLTLTPTTGSGKAVTFTKVVEAASNAPDE